MDNMHTNRPHHFHADTTPTQTGNQISYIKWIPKEYLKINPTNIKDISFETFI